LSGRLLEGAEMDEDNERYSSRSLSSQLTEICASEAMLRCAVTTIAPKCAVRRLHAGHAMHTVFVSDFDARIAQIAERGLESAARETYANGVRKATFRDPDGNEIGSGGYTA
jgi:hypothetical protein